MKNIFSFSHNFKLENRWGKIDEMRKQETTDATKRISKKKQVSTGQSWNCRKESMVES